MAPRASKRATLPKVKVTLHRQGLVMECDAVAWENAGECAARLLETFRTLTDRFPELIPELSPVGGGSPIEVRDDDDWESERRVGF